jgi:hypothetical protein
LNLNPNTTAFGVQLSIWSNLPERRIWGVWSLVRYATVTLL